MTLRLLTPVVAACILATLAPNPSAAQLTGPSHIEAIRASFASQPSYRTALSNGTLRLTDTRSGAEIFTIQESELGTLTMRGVVSTQGLHISRTKLNSLVQEYNDHAMMGTLWQIAGGVGVELLYHLNGRTITSATAVDLAQKFGQEMRGELAEVIRR